MEPLCLRLDDLPRTTKLFSAFLDDFPRVAKFYEHPPNEQGVIDAARAVKLDPSVRKAVVEILREENRAFGSDTSVEKNLDRLAGGAVAIVSGQQVGLFGGPAYSFYKALAAIRWAEHLSVRGIDAVPVFWLASEDHDLAEVDHTFWLSRDSLHRLKVELAPGTAGRPVGQLVFGPEIDDVVDAAAKTLAGPFTPDVERALRQAYVPGENFGSAFGKLFARCFAGRGLILLDPLDARLHRIAAPVFRRAIDEAVTLRDELLSRDKALEAAGYHAQVKVTSESTLLFMLVDGVREAVRMRGDRFVASGITISPGELLKAIDQTPEIFSPNVLLRAIVQDTLLPTAAYIGGPAEVAYMAQVEVVYRRLLGRMPAILSRPGFTLVEPHVARLLEKYELTMPEIFRGRQSVHSALATHSLPRGLESRFERDEKAIRKLLKNFAKPIARLDGTLTGALENTERKMLYQFLKLRRKVGQAQGLRSGTIERHERMILDSLYPGREPQERALNFLPFLAAYGPEILDSLAKCADGGAPQHRVVFL